MTEDYSSIIIIIIDSVDKQSAVSARPEDEVQHCAGAAAGPPTEQSVLNLGVNWAPLAAPLTVLTVCVGEPLVSKAVGSTELYHTNHVPPNFTAFAKGLSESGVGLRLTD